MTTNPETNTSTSDRQASDSLVLVVDDRADVRRVVATMLAKEGYGVEAFACGEDCLASLARLLPDAIYLDLDMPGLGGLETLTRIRAKNPSVPVIMLTADDTVESVVTAMRLGAYDYLPKPVRRRKLATVTKNAIERYRLSFQVASLEREAGRHAYPELIGRSEAMKEVFRQMDRLAATEITILVHGESGTGKELVSQAIHAHSTRRDGPFVALNCAAIPETLQESELFGHERGAFTGATESRKGKFELADQGTLFLDEVGELSLPLQAKLLRTLQEGTFQRVGGSRELRSDFRLIAATHRHLADDVQSGRFREDLYFRIVVFELELPALRERSDDVEALVDHFLTSHAKKTGGSAKIASEALDVLKAYPWPGNVREMENVIQRAIVFNDSGVIRVEHLPPRICIDGTASPRRAAPVSRTEAAAAAPDTDAPEELNLDALERRAIETAMTRSGGNVTEVGRLLGISRATLYRKLKKYKIR